MQGSPGPWSSPALTAAISQAGGLGSLGTALVAADQIRAQVERVRSLTDKPLAVNHTLRPLSEEAYALTLELAPPVISVALGCGRTSWTGRMPAAACSLSSCIRSSKPNGPPMPAPTRSLPRAPRPAGSAARFRPWRSCPKSSTRSRRCRLAAGGIADEPAGEIVRSLVEGAQVALRDP